MLKVKTNFGLCLGVKIDNCFLGLRRISFEGDKSVFGPLLDSAPQSSWKSVFVF